LTTESRRAAQALARMQRIAQTRSLVWVLLTAALCTLIPTLIARWTLPSPQEIAALRVERDRLRQSIAGLEQHGGKVDWHRCGEASRLCVRIDRAAPTYGAKGDYFVVK
jgi:hypothetical protein